MSNTTQWRVLQGDARKLDLPDQGVHMIVTSVPYWGLRAYLDDPQEIGREPTLQAWLDNLVDCAREWRRVLRDDGTLWVNCGDSYASSSLSDRPSNPGLTGAHDLNPERKTPSDGLKPKDLLGLHWRFAFALQADGWYLRSSIVWCKGLDWSDTEREAQEDIRQALAQVRQQAAGSLWGLSKDMKQALDCAERAVERLAMSGAAMPESVQDRPTSSYEMLFLLSKSERYFYDKAAIRVPYSVATIARVNQDTFDSQTGGPADYGSNGVNASRSARRALENLAQAIASGGDGRNARNVWRVPLDPSPVGGYQLSDGRVVNHFAAFPKGLAARAILAGTSEAGACAKCGAPFKRVERPTPEYAQLLGQDWADYEQDAQEGRGHSVGGQRPTKRGKAARGGYVTVGWVPTCRCYGEPIEEGTDCPKCRGTGMERVLHAAGRTESGYAEGTNANRLALLRQAARMTGKEYNSTFDGVETGAPCPHCLCSDCGGDGLEKAYPRGSEPYKAQRLPDRGPTSIQTDHDGRDFAKPQPTGNPCPTCGGKGATGKVNGEVWPDSVIEDWPRTPCTVLDPMGGTGQTGMAALDLGRAVVLNDLHPDYCTLMRERLAAWPCGIPRACDEHPNGH